MQKIVLLLLPLVLFGCDKTFDEIIDSSPNSYQVANIEGIKDTIDLRNPGDSLLTVRVILQQGSEINYASFDLLDPDNVLINSSPVELIFVNDTVYQNQLVMQEEFTNGKYTVNVFIVGTNGANNLAAVSTFRFNNGINYPPEIANTIIEPDTVTVTTTTVLFTSVEATDPNGKNDIEQVFFVVYRPDGTSNNNRNQLYDDGSCCPLPPGNEPSGDDMEGDGVYSRIIEVNENNDKGTYRFEFQAVDRGGKYSNKIDHFVLIQ